ncbi:MAG: DUF3373 family protein [Sulfuricurvum sp.]
MNKITLSIVLAALYCSSSMADEAALQAQIENLLKRIEQLENKQMQTQKTQDELKASQETVKEEQTAQADLISKVNAQSANDNIKWDIDFRSAVHSIAYTDSNGKTQDNTFFTNRLWLGLGSKVNDDLFINGQIAVYNYWGAEPEDMALNDNWRSSSRPHDLSLRLRQAYFVYRIGKDWTIPMNFSVGRRAAVDGFLANHREGNEKPGSPLAHITNMEVDGAMMQFDFDHILFPGSYLKIVYGRSHDPMSTATYQTMPYLTDNTGGDDTVDFIVLPMSLYNDGQHNLMAEYAHISNVKGDSMKAAGTAHLGAISYQLDGLNDDNEFLEDTTFFASVAFSQTHPDRGIPMLGSLDDKNGYSFWTGLIFPDLITDGGKFGLEYNHGTKYWTPMTWAEDSMTGSKVAIRGDAYEAYWNIPIVGKNLTAQLRYTYLDHDYSANTSYMVDPNIQNLNHSQELRAFVRYRY